MKPFWIGWDPPLWSKKSECFLITFFLLWPRPPRPPFDRKSKNTSFFLLMPPLSREVISLFICRIRCHFQARNTFDRKCRSTHPLVWPAAAPAPAESGGEEMTTFLPPTFIRGWDLKLQKGVSQKHVFGKNDHPGDDSTLRSMLLLVLLL